MPNNFCDRGYEDTWIKISEEKSRNLYIPKMTISNAKEIKKLLNYGRNDNADYIWFGQPNLLEYRERLKLTIYCSFTFENYPFDSHHCNINLGSLDFTELHIKLMPLTVAHEHKSTFYGKEASSVNLSQK